VDEKYYILISRFLTGEATEEESAKLNKWLNESEKNRQAFNKMEQLWQNTPLPQPESIPPFEEVWQNIENKLESSHLRLSEAKDDSKMNKVKRSKIHFFNFRYAAAAAIFVVIGSIFLYQFAIKNMSLQTYSTQLAEKRTITLPDGSQVKLNADTRIQFQKVFDDSERAVFLEGQAFFDIERDGRPFIIQTDNAQVVVVGTSFNVEARKHKTKVIVKSGTVRLLSKNSSTGEGVLLKKNEMSACLENFSPVPPVTVDADYLLGWLQNKHIFDKTPLDEIIEELRRSYDIKIKIADLSIARLELSGEFNDQPPKEILSLICLALDLDYHIENGVYTITR